MERRLQHKHQNPELRLSVDERKNICLYEQELMMHKKWSFIKGLPSYAIVFFRYAILVKKSYHYGTIR